ncbi:hypothetical protein C7M84_019739 [Penaeus vannamei]|uniref:Uncharacterized protein n=1 Tax=Penaeus vannamei TaxID=6689 RepID=A0A3R7NN75_PENVA|nr:hypothetical protein C7M84_019739 [Penaeus vannamei]
MFFCFPLSSQPAGRAPDSPAYPRSALTPFHLASLLSLGPSPPYRPPPCNPASPSPLVPSSLSLSSSPLAHSIASPRPLSKLSALPPRRLVTHDAFHSLFFRSLFLSRRWPIDSDIGPLPRLPFASLPLSRRAVSHVAFPVPSLFKESLPYFRRSHRAGYERSGNLNSRAAELRRVRGGARGGGREASFRAFDTPRGLWHDPTRPAPFSHRCLPPYPYLFRKCLCLSAPSSSLPRGLGNEIAIPGLAIFGGSRLRLEIRVLFENAVTFGAESFRRVQSWKWPEVPPRRNVARGMRTGGRGGVGAGWRGCRRPFSLPRSLDDRSWLSRLRPCPGSRVPHVVTAPSSRGDRPLLSRSFTTVPPRAPSPAGGSADFRVDNDYERDYLPLNSGFAPRAVFKFPSRRARPLRPSVCAVSCSLGLPLSLSLAPSFGPVSVHPSLAPPVPPLFLLSPFFLFIPPSHFPPLPSSFLLPSYLSLPLFLLPPKPSSLSPPSLHFPLFSPLLPFLSTCSRPLSHPPIATNNAAPLL